MSLTTIEVEKYNVHNLLAKERLCIPGYQRPYKWQKKNVLALIKDIQHSLDQKQPAYRIGTVVLHKDESNDKTELNIVDGQQRLITITLILFALGEQSTGLLDTEFIHAVSKENIRYNYQIIKNWFNDIGQEEKTKFRNYLKDQCEFVTITLNDISEAFQFFDSQNARGRSLTPYDLLKAFHLREIDIKEEAVKKLCAKNWEQAVENETLELIIGSMMYRIRKWSKGVPAGIFSKDDIKEFKGITLRNQNYPYLKPYRLNDALVEQYQNDPVQKALGQVIDFPYQLTQVILNGKRFFEMVHHYTQMHEQLFKKNNGVFTTFYKDNTRYTGSGRAGDQYVLELFQAITLTYVDRFGATGFEAIYEYLYMWAYRLRLENKSVRYQSIDNYCLNRGNAFKKMTNYFYAEDSLAIRQHVNPDKKDRKIETVENVFTKKGIKLPT